MEKTANSLKSLRGPKKIPVIGNFHQIKQNQIHRILLKWAMTYGDRYLIQFGPKPAIVLSEVTAIQRLLKDRPQGFRRLAKIEQVLNDFSGNGLFSAEGNQWKKERGLVTRGLGVGPIKQFYPTLLQLVERLKMRLELLAESKEGTDIQNDFMRFTVDVTCSLAFGYDPKSLINDEDQLQKNLQKVFPILGHRMQSPFPYWRYIRFKKDREFDQSIAEVKEFIFRLIEKTRLQFNAPPKTILEHLLMLQKSDQGSTAPAFSNNELFGNILTLMLAGEDTTANTLAWAVYFLLDHPAVVTQMAEEISRVLGDDPNAPPAYESLERLVFIEAVAKETMRLKPVAPFLFFENLEAFTLDDLTVPPNTCLVTFFFKNYLNDACFTNAAEFFPERWVQDPKAGFNHRPEVFMPFGFGPRFCPGAALALVEMKLVLVMLVRYFNFEKSANYHPQEEFNFTLMPTGLWVKPNKKQPTRKPSPS